MAKITFGEALDMLADDMPLKASQISASALRRTVWVASNGYPGCLNDYTAACSTKREAIEIAMSMADTEDGPPLGMKSWLKAGGDRTWTTQGYLYRVEKMTLADLF